MSNETILTGLRTNGEYHLGNYLGAMMPIIDMANQHADEYQINMFLPDLHSFTTPIDHSTFHAQTMHNMRLFVACGLPIDHDSVYLYRQSRISAHTELSWILSCFTGFGEMSRMVEFKDKSEKLSEDRVSIGLFTYPILMAADILLYGAKWVPVGEDQRQHLEFTRDIAERMNNQFGELFVVPETIKKQQDFVSRDSAPRIRSLRDPSKKMSKSVDDPSGTIMMSDTAEQIRKKIMRAETDTVGKVNFDWDAQPGVTNLLQILALMAGRTQNDVNAEWKNNEKYGDLKTAVAAAIITKLGKIQEAMQDLSETDVLQHVEQSEEVMKEQALTQLHKVQRAVGLRA